MANPGQNKYLFMYGIERFCMLTLICTVRNRIPHMNNSKCSEEAQEPIVAAPLFLYNHVKQLCIASSSDSACACI